jgi:acyl-CoA synthetase (AMP-forming)/AMP-acid ligase II
VRADEIRRATTHLGAVLVQGYGRLEGAWPIAILGIDDHRAILDGDDRMAASCGKPIDQVEVKIRPVGEGDSNYGELCVRSPMTSRDYADPDGWCGLGDLVEIDHSGYLFHKGRLDRMINTGYHVYPAEIEGVISGVLGVDAVRVRGEWGCGNEIVVAELVIAAGVRQDDVIDRVKRELTGRLAKYKIPDQFRVVDTLRPE